MYLSRISFCVLLLLLYTIGMQAQEIRDTLHDVKVIGKHTEHTSTDKRLDFSPGQKVKGFDSITLEQYQFQNISNLLSQQSSIFIKSYGFNNLATLNFRGASAAQSIVLWNGVPIQNAALGIADVSSLPILLTGNVNVVYGSSAALWGSGNVGGAVLLDDAKPVFDTNSRPKVSLFMGAGSFAQYTIGIKAAFNTKKWYVAVNGIWQAAKNDFPYTDANGANMTMPNALLHGGGIQLNTAYQINKEQVLSLSLWYQQYDREIPPALFEQYSVKDLRNNSLRMLLDWNKQNRNNTIYSKASFTQDKMHYTDTSIEVVTDNTVYQYYQELGWKHIINNNNKFLVFVPVQIAWMQLPTNGQIKQQSRSAIATTYDAGFFDHKLDIAANLREEIVNSNNILLPGVDASFMLTHWLSLKANVQRTYRVPTLNELYYFPGGNASLKPEEGWNEDGGYIIKLKNNSGFQLQHELSYFNRNINNWIAWFGGAFWTPHNIATVYSRGVETENSFQYSFKKWKFHAGINTSYVLATTTSSYIPNDGSIGKQIPYTPRYNEQMNIGFAFKEFYFNYNHTYTGYRFITTDESEYELPYNIGNLQLMYTYPIKEFLLSFNAQCNNIWNNKYDVIAYRPMPGINWMTGIRLQYK